MLLSLHISNFSVISVPEFLLSTALQEVGGFVLDTSHEDF
jgi:hypothetical protein